jgi:uracil-DNA glycosylase
VPSFLEAELRALTGVRVVVALGRIAFDNYLTVLRNAGRIGSRSGFVFAHNRVHRTGTTDPVLISSYHPSQQNTSTGKLTEPMLLAVFEQAREILG